jgi:hypothetical protein
LLVTENGTPSKHASSYSPRLKNKKGGGRQDRNPRHKNDGYKNKKKINVMQAMWSVESDDNNIDDSGIKPGDEKELNLALIARVKRRSLQIDVDEIISSKNISDDKTIELLRNIAMSKNKDLESRQ